MFDYDNALLNFVATLSGVGLAFFLTLRYDRWKKANDEKESRKLMLSSVKKELETDSQILKDLSAGETYIGAHMLLWTDAYQSAVSGGDIILLHPTLQTQLALIYLDFKQLGRYGQKILDLLGVSDRVLSDVTKLMKQSLEATLKHLPMAIAVIDVELRELSAPSRWRRLPARSKRMSVWIYIYVSFGIFILAIFNFVFTKLLDRLYGNFNALDVEYVFGWTVLFIFGFGIYLWAVDIKGILAGMLGQAEHKDKKTKKGLET
jgi:hypothetical protein